MNNSLTKQSLIKKKSVLEIEEKNQLSNLFNILSNYSKKEKKTHDDKTFKQQIQNSSKNEDQAHNLLSSNNTGEDQTNMSSNNTGEDQTNMSSNNTDEDQTNMSSNNTGGDQTNMSSNNTGETDLSEEIYDDDFELYYYNDDEVDNQSNLSDDFNNRSDYLFDDSNNDDENLTILPYSKLDGFSIREMFDLQKGIESLNERIFDDSKNALLYNHQSCVMTRAKFWEEFNNLKLKYNFSKACTDEFLLFMQKSFPTADLANVIHLDYQSDDSEYYFHKYFKKITIDVCINGCMVYSGKYRLNDSCLFCSELRYWPTGKGSKKTIEYRSILLLLEDLISSHPSFLDLINYYDYGMKTDPQSEYFKDIKDGESYIRNMNEMKRNFRKYQISRDDKTRKLIMVNLCLSWFYDGCQVYHHLIYSFLPMIFTILNLPPPLRNKLGIGTFLLSINSLAPGSFVEFFLLFDCFVQELLELYDGVSFNVGDTEYFIQCRLICSILDLPALCKLFNFAAMYNSEEGCVLCNWGGGLYNYFIKKIKYTNTRSHLPLRHYLRSIGFKLCDCPPTKNKKDGPLIDQCKEQKFCKLWGRGVKKWIPLFNQFSKDPLNKNKISGYIWYNQDIAEIDEIAMTIKNEAAFELQDYNLSVPYTRYKNEHYDKKATLAIKKKERTQSKSQLKKISVNGIKGFSPLRALTYINYPSDICQDSAHVLFVLALMILNIWSCDKENYRMFKAGVKEYYKDFEFQNVFDCLWDNKIIIPWNFNKNEQLRVEGYLKCLLIPMGISSKFRIVKGNIFKQKGIIKGSGKITVISVFMNLILFANLHMSVGYRALFRIFSNVFSRVRNKKVCKIDILPLFRRCNELRSFWEGCIPITEMIQMLHALEDISMHIPKQGPTAGFNALHGEQAIGIIKNLCHTKGSSRPELQALKKAAALEFHSAKNFYSKLDSNRLIYEYPSLYWNTSSHSYVNNPERILFDGLYESFNFNRIEFSYLLESFHRIILKHFRYNEVEAITNSSLFRILNLFKHKNEKIVMNFLESLIEKFDAAVAKCIGDEKRKYQQLETHKIFKSIKDSTIGIIESDINEIRRIIKFYLGKPLFKIYTRAILPFSIKLRGRGFGYSENNKESNEENNCLNNLEEQFYKVEQYSSWCKIRFQITERRPSRSNPAEMETIEVDKEYYGQVNYFFQFTDESEKFPDYSILKTIQFASATTYTFHHHDSFKDIHTNNILSNSRLNTINIINGNCSNMNKSNSLFVRLDEILPTNVLTFAFIDRGSFSYKAIYPYHDFNSPDLEEYVEADIIISLNDETWRWKDDWYLTFIDGNPENIIKKESKSVLDDVDDSDKFYEEIKPNVFKYWY